MTAGLPASGQLSMGDISVEILRASTAETDLNATDVRTLFSVGSGQISYSNGYGKRWVTPGSYGNPGVGTTYWYIPRYQYLTIDLYAGGGGEGGGCGNDGFAYGYCGGCGGDGGSSVLYSPNAVVAYGGGAGCPGGGGGSGYGYGGTVYPGGAGNGGYTGCSGGGGGGGRVYKRWTFGVDADRPAWFSTLTLVVGGGGGGGSPGESACGGGGGGSGSAYLSWS